MPDIRNYQFRLYPTKQQENRLENNLNVCKWVYNKFVEQIQNSFLSRNDMNYILTELKEQEPWLYKYHSKMLQMISTKLDNAQKTLIKLRKKGCKTGKIKFIKYNEYRTFTYNQSGYRLTKHGDTNLLYLSKIGHIEIRLHREISDVIKQIIVTRTKRGKWCACITCEINNIIAPKLNFEKIVGIDVGIKNFVYDSEGNRVSNPLNLKKMLKPVRRVQRKISRKRKGSNNRLKVIKRMQKIYEKIVNSRKDFQHKVSTHYAKNYDVIFVERLQTLNMIKNHKLSRSIMDSSWATFLQKLDYKCKLMVEVSPRNTTIDCSRCGNKVRKSLAVRIHRCNTCNLVIDRDYNASINILQKGLEIFGIEPKVINYLNCELPQEMRKVTPVKIVKIYEAGKNQLF